MGSPGTIRLDGGFTINDLSHHEADRFQHQGQQCAIVGIIVGDQNLLGRLPGLRPVTCVLRISPLTKRGVKQINTEILTHGGCFIEVQAIIRFKNGPNNGGHSFVPDSDIISGITEVPLKFRNKIIIYRYIIKFGRNLEGSS